MATETEIEAMARALSHQAQEEPNVMWRNWTSQAAVAAEALDRVRAENEKAEDHEAGIQAALAVDGGWADSEDSVRRMIAAYLSRCPSPVSGTEPDTAKLVEARDKLIEIRNHAHANWRGGYADLADEALAALAAFSVDAGKPSDETR